MNVERIPITDRAQWLALRSQDCTASTIAALFGCHPYETALGLYIAKSGFEVSEPDNAVLRRGRLLEGAVALAVEEQRPDWRIEKATEYFRDPAARIGATPDFFVHGDPRGLGIIQAKTVAPSVFKRQWTDTGPPFWIALQAATEMMLTGATWGAVAALVVDPFRLDCHIYEVPRHEGVEKRIRAAVAKFWSDVEAGREPEPDYGADAELIAAMYPAETPAKTIDLTGDNYAATLLAERAEIKARMKVDETRCREVEAEIKHKLADAEIATIGGDWRVSFRVQHRKAYSVAASSSRVLRITDSRPTREHDHDDDSRRPF